MNKEQSFEKHKVPSQNLINLFSTNPFIKILNNKSLKILDLGCGYGQLANYFFKRKFINYTGVDGNIRAVNYCKKRYSCFDFIEDDVIDFMKNSTTNYNVIIMSHLFEHLDKNRAKNLLLLIKNKLVKGGVLINFMPNPHAYFNSLSVSPGSYFCHRHLYNINDFNYLLNEVGFSHFNHFNLLIGKNFLERVIHKWCLFFFNFLLLSLGYHTETIYTEAYCSMIRR